MTATAAVPLPHPHAAGSVRAAWSYRAFRIIWFGQAASMMGTWMQNVALPAYVQSRWESGTLVGLIVFAQLGPMLLLSVPGSLLANRLPRKPWLLTMPAIQMTAAFALAALVASDAAFLALFLANTLMGVGTALNGPAFQASIPLLVDRRDLAGAIALNSAQLNGTRVLGPLLAGVLTAAGATVSQLLLLNAVTFVFIVAAVALVDIPDVRSHVAEQGWRQLTVGVRIARAKPILGRLLVTMTAFALLGLPFIGLFPTVTREAFGLDPSSAAYSWMYATFGLGSLIGSLAGATWWAERPKSQLIRPALAAFAVALLTFSQLRSPGPAYVAALCLGAAYMLAITSMSTVFQQSMADQDRTFLMALWMMSFGGTVPIGNLAFGPVIDAIGPRWVLGMGAAVAAGLAWWCSPAVLERLARSGSRSGGPEAGGDALQPGHPTALHQHGDFGAD